METKVSRLQVLADEAASCTQCKLHEGRHKSVFSRGSPDAEICFVGEGPGADEDEQGLPFVGRAGQLLDKMIAAMGLQRDEVYVCNIVKCRPPNNRVPERDEMEKCMPFLISQLGIVEPKVVVALGATAVRGLIGGTEGITKIRGGWKLFKGRIPLMPTFHPSYILRQYTVETRTAVWSDLQKVLLHVGRPIPGTGFNR